MTGAESASALPEFGEIAANLAGLAAILPGPANSFREGLQRVSGYLLPAGRDLTKARSELGLLVMALTGRGQVFDVPETWITCACVVLLAHEQMRLAGGFAAAPTGSQLS